MNASTLSRFHASTLPRFHASTAAISGVILLAVAAVACGGPILVAEDADVKLLVALVDATDGYTAETEKKAGDTTVTYCDVTDGNTASAYDDTGNWVEIGDGTGNYILTIGASEFDDPDHVYFVQVAVDGCRTVRLWVHTLYEPLGQLAQVDTAGQVITVDGNDLVQAVLHDVSAASGVGTIADVNTALDTKLPADFNTVTVASNAVLATLANGAHGGAAASITLADYSDFQGAGSLTVDEINDSLDAKLPADFNTVTVASNAVLATLANGAHGGAAAAITLADYSDFQGAGSLTVADINDLLDAKLPADFNTVTVTSGNLHAHLKAADDNVIIDPNVADIWNALIATYSGTDGSVAEQLAAAGAAGDPWLTELPGEYGEDSAGYIIGTLLQGIVDDWLDGGRLDLLLDTAAAGGSSSGSAWKQVK